MRYAVDVGKYYEVKEVPEVFSVSTAAIEVKLIIFGIEYNKINYNVLVL